MRCALVDLSTNIVVNLIIANPELDVPPVGYLIVGIPDDSPVQFDWIYNPTTNEFTPPPEQ